MKISIASAMVLLLLGAVAQAEYRPTDPENTVVVQVDDGLIVIELNSRFAPQTTRQFKRLVRDGFYDGQPFYRVIDGFVAQGGDGSDMSGEENDEPTVAAEFDLEWSEDIPFVAVQTGDLFAPETGFVDGFPVARDPDAEKLWIAHCPGIVGLARGDAADSGSTDFYIVIGQAPRYLERNITAFGRVIHGMDVVQRIKRGPAETAGMIERLTDATVIRSAQVLADIPVAGRLPVTVPDTNSEEFAAMLEARRHRTAAWFVNTPPAVLDVCQVPNQGVLQR